MTALPENCRWILAIGIVGEPITEQALTLARREATRRGAPFVISTEENDGTHTAESIVVYLLLATWAKYAHMRAGLSLVPKNTAPPLLYARSQRTGAGGGFTFDPEMPEQVTYFFDMVAAMHEDRS